MNGVLTVNAIQVGSGRNGASFSLGLGDYQTDQEVLEACQHLATHYAHFEVPAGAIVMVVINAVGLREDGAGGVAWQSIQIMTPAGRDELGRIWAALIEALLPVAMHPRRRADGTPVAEPPLDGTPGANAPGSVARH